MTFVLLFVGYLLKSILITLSIVGGFYLGDILFKKYKKYKKKEEAKRKPRSRYPNQGFMNDIEYQNLCMLIDRRMQIQEAQFMDALVEQLCEQGKDSTKKGKEAYISSFKPVKFSKSHSDGEFEKLTDAQLLARAKLDEHVNNENSDMPTPSFIRESVYTKQNDTFFTFSKEVEQPVWYRWCRIAGNIFVGGAIAGAADWLFGFNKHKHIIKDTLEDFQLPFVAERCPGAKDGGFYEKNDHLFCLHKDGSSCTVWNAVESWQLKKITFQMIRDAQVNAPDNDHLLAVCKLFIQKLNVSSWNKDITLIRTIALDFEGYGFSYTQLKKVLALHQNALYTTHFTQIKCLVFLFMMPLVMIMPAFAIILIAYLGVDFGYHYFSKRFADKYQKMTGVIHSVAMKSIVGVAAILALFGGVCYAWKWYKNRSKQKNFVEQVKLRDGVNITSIITAFSDLLLHCIDMFGVKIPEEVAKAVEKLLVTTKLSNNLARSFSIWNDSKSDQAKVSDLNDHTLKLFQSAIDQGIITADAFQAWVAQENETLPDWLLRQEFQTKYWSYLDTLPLLEIETLYNVWKYDEAKFNLREFGVLTSLPWTFDAYKYSNSMKFGAIPKEDEEKVDELDDGSSALMKVWQKTRSCWTDKKIPKEILYILIGLCTLLIGGGMIYKYAGKKKTDDSLIKEEDEGKKMSDYRSGTNKQKLKQRYAASGLINRNDDIDVATTHAPKVGKITKLMDSMGPLSYETRAPITQPMGVKRPSELAGYEYVFIRVGNRVVKWSVRMDQMRVASQLRQLFSLAKEAGEKVFVLLPVRETSGEPSHIYTQMGYELKPEGFDPLAGGKMFVYSLQPDLLCFDEETVLENNLYINQRSKVPTQANITNAERNDMTIIVADTLGMMNRHVFSYWADLKDLSAKVVNAISREEKQVREEGLVGGRLISLSEVQRSIFEIRRENGIMGHGFVADSKCYTCKHVLLKSGESKDTVLSDIVEYQFRTLNGTSFVGTISVLVDGQNSDYVVFKILPIKNKGPIPPFPSLKIHKCVEEKISWEGSGIMFTSPLLESPQVRFSCGKVWKGPQHISHMIPTVSGMSGAPILTTEGLVVGIHRGTLQLTNHGIPLDMCVSAPNVHADENYLQQGFDKRARYTLIPPSIEPLNHHKVFEEDGVLKTFDLPELKRYDYLGRIEEVTYKQEFMFKIDVITNVMDIEGYHIWHNKYAPIHPNLESCYRDIVKRDNVLDVNQLTLDQDSYDLAWDICTQRWDKCMLEADVQHVMQHSAVIPWDEVITCTPTIEVTQDGMEEIHQLYESQYLSLLKQPGLPDNIYFYSLDHLLKHTYVSMTRFNEDLFHLKYDPDRMLCLWEVRRKKEFRDIVRVLANKGRAYYPICADFKILGKQLFHHQNAIMASSPIWLKRNFLGETVFYGNWHVRSTLLHKFPHINKNDVECWDGSARRRFFERVKLWRKRHLNPKYHLAVDNYYDHLMRSPIVMPDGCVFRKKYEEDDDQKSGQENTLDDNSKINDFCATYCEVKFLKRRQNWPDSQIKLEINERFFHIVMGDDCDLATDYEDFTNQYMSDCYNDLGFRLDKQDLPHHDWKDPFCGFRTKQILGYYLPYLDPDRIFDAVRFNKDINPLQILDKLESLFMLSAPEPPAAAKMHRFIIRYVQHLLYDDRFIGLYQNGVTKVQVEKKWASFMTYEDAIAHYFPVEENILSLQDKLDIQDKLIEEFDSIISAQCMEMKYGNYCGSNWSDGKSQASVANGSSEPVDEFDAACRSHDADYANATNKRQLVRADEKFEKRAWKSGVIPGLAGTATRLYNNYIGHEGYALRPKGKGKTSRGVIVNSTVNNQQSSIGKEVGMVPNRLSSSIQSGGDMKVSEDSMTTNKNVQKRFKMAKGKKGKKASNKAKGARKGKKKATKFARTNTSAVPMARNFNMRLKGPKVNFKQGDSKMIQSGEILMTNLTWPASVGPGDVLVDLLIAPQNLQTTELQLYARMFEKYKFTKLVMEYRPACATTSTGQFVMFFDPDERDVQLSGLNGVRSAQSIKGNDTLVVYSKGACKYFDKKKNPFYWTEDVSTDDSLVYQARFKVVSNTSVSGGPTFAAGSFYLKYTCVFWDRHNQWSSVTNFGKARLDCNGNAFLTSSNSTKSSYENRLGGGSSFSWTGFRPGDIIFATLTCAGTSVAIQYSGNNGLTNVSTFGGTTTLGSTFALIVIGTVSSVSGGFDIIINSLDVDVNLPVYAFVFPINESYTSMSSPVPQNKEQKEYAKMEALFQKYIENKNSLERSEKVLQIKDLTNSELNNAFELVSDENRKRSFSPTRTITNLVKPSNKN